MFDKIIDFLLSILHEIMPWVIINEYDRGIRLRFGKFKQIVGPGIHFKIPYIEEVFTHTVVTTTMNLPSQSLITKDEKNIVVKAVIKYKISDIKIFLLDVCDAVDAISDMTMGIIKKIIMERNWEECKDNDLDDLITKKARIESKKWGIEITQVTLSDMGVIRSFKMFNDHSHH